MFVDVEKIARTYLADATTLPTSTAVPKPRPRRFLRLQVGGSQPRTLVHRDTLLTVECWNADSEAAASHDAELVYEVLDAWDLVPTFDGWRSAPYPQPDPDTGCPRYVMTCVVRHRLED